MTVRPEGRGLNREDEVYGPVGGVAGPPGPASLCVSAPSGVTALQSDPAPGCGRCWKHRSETGTVSVTWRRGPHPFWPQGPVRPVARRSPPR